MGEVVLGRAGGDTDPDRPFPDGELLKLLECAPGFTVSNALPKPGDVATPEELFEFGKVYGVNLCPPFM